MNLRGRITKLERNGSAHFSTYYCTTCRERWRTPAGTLLDFHLYDFQCKRAERYDEEAPAPEKHIAELRHHADHLGADDKILDLTGGFSIVPPPAIAKMNMGSGSS